MRGVSVRHLYHTYGIVVIHEAILSSPVCHGVARVWLCGVICFGERLLAPDQIVQKVSRRFAKRLVDKACRAIWCW